MPELANAYGGPGTVIGGPAVGALVPFVLGPFTTATTVVSGAGEIGIKCPCDLRLESVTWAFMTAPGAASTMAIFNHTATNGGAGGTAVLAATAITAEGAVEGAAFVSSAVRNFTKGQFIVLDMVIGTSAPVNMVVTIMAYISGHAVADRAQL